MASLSTQRARLSYLNTQSLIIPLTSTSLIQQSLSNRRQHLRYSSGKSHTRSPTTAQHNEKRIPSTSSTSSTPLANDVNPPPSTLPADLELPESLPPSAGLADKGKWLFATGRAYVSFYKTGLKNVISNYRTSLPIRRQLGVPAHLPTSLPPQIFLEKSKNSNSEVQRSRSTFQLLHRAAFDVRRLIPFSLILIVFGELTPFLILAFGTAVVPYTCRIPRQLAKSRAQATDRKRRALSAHSIAAKGSSTPPELGSKEELGILANFAGRKFAKEAQPEEILRACAVFGLAKTHSRPSFLVNSVYRPRLRKFAEYLELDDKLIRDCGGVSAMQRTEVRVAVDERGGFGLSRGIEGPEAERTERRWLEQWLKRSG
ncbi:hypothetical protein BDV18DRAFT_160937 [Aspergillus unguis]